MKRNSYSLKKSSLLLLKFDIVVEVGMQRGEVEFKKGYIFSVFIVDEFEDVFQEVKDPFLIGDSVF